MEKFKERMKNIFMTQPTWFDASGAGHYVMRRRLKTWTKALIGVCAVAVLVAVWGLRSGKDEIIEPERDVKETEVIVKTTDNPKPSNPSEPKLIAVKPLEPLSLEPALTPITPEDSQNGNLLAFVPKGVQIDITPEEEETDKKKETKKVIKKNIEGDLNIKKEEQYPQPEPKSKPEKNVPMRQNLYWIRISKRDYTLSLYRGDEVVKTYSIAVGENPGNKRYIGDHRTPVGDFRVVSIEDSSKWKHDFGDGKGKIAGAYGPWFIRLDTGGWKGIGIHGTHDPDSRGTMATEGCIRLSNEEISDLRRYAYRNMRVLIEE